MSKANHLMEEELVKVRAMLKEGYKINYIALKVNRDVSTIYRYVDKKYKRTYKKWTNEEKNKAKELRDRGMSISKIASILGRNRVTVVNMFFQERKKESM